MSQLATTTVKGKMSLFFFRPVGDTQAQQESQCNVAESKYEVTRDALVVWFWVVSLFVFFL